jgi:hypothetical protein
MVDVDALHQMQWDRVRLIRNCKSEEIVSFY